jgi:hypothetical protein
LERQRIGAAIIIADTIQRIVYFVYSLGILIRQAALHPLPGN